MKIKKAPSEPCEVRLNFQTSLSQANRIDQAVRNKRISMAEWLRQAAEKQLKRQRL